MFNESDDELEVFTPPVDFNRNGGWCRKNVVFVLSVMSIDRFSKVPYCFRSSDNDLRFAHNT